MIISFIQNSNCKDITKWMGFCIGSGFTEKRLAHISVTRSLAGQYQHEYDTIYLL